MKVRISRRKINKCLYKTHIIEVGQEFDFTKSFTYVLTEQKSRVEQKTREGKHYYTLNKCSVGKGKKKEVYINVGSGFDCETSNCNLDTTFSFPYCFQLSLADHIYIVRDCNRAGEIFESLSEAMHLVFEDCKLIVWDANISFEYAHFKRLWNNNISSAFAKDVRKPLYLEFNGNIVLRECIGVFGRSLSHIAEQYTHTQKLKGDLDYNLMRSSTTPIKPREMLYCINDVAILSELTETAFKLYFRKHKKVPFTATGKVRAITLETLGSKRSNKESEVKKLLCNREYYNYFRNYVYAGGLTHSLAQRLNGEIVKGEKQYNIRAYDLVSSYPAILATEYFPTGDIISYKGLSTKETCEKLSQHKHYIMIAVIEDVETKTGHSLISKDKVLFYAEDTDKFNPVLDNGRIYACKRAVYSFTELDWKMFKMNYNFNTKSFKFLNAFGFTKSTKCDDFIRDNTINLYIQKDKIKSKKKVVDKKRKVLSEKKDIEGLTAEETETLNKLSAEYKELCITYDETKALLNSLYGMCGTQLYEVAMEYSKTKGEFTQGETKDFDTLNTPFNPFIAYWTTAYSRLRLTEVITKFPDDVIQYDTDSVYCRADNTELIDYIKEINNRITERNKREIPEATEETKGLLSLGLWDIDGTYEYIIPLGSKRYLGAHSDTETHEEFNKKNTADNRKEIREKYSRKINLTEEMITEYIYREAKYKITFAGAVKSDVIMNSIISGKSLEEYIKHFTIMSDTSTKLTGCYYDTPQTHSLVDYEGTPFTVTWYSGEELTDKKFNADLVIELNAQEKFKGVFTGL